MPGAAADPRHAIPAAPTSLGGGRNHCECLGVAPFVSKRLDIAVVQQYLPALRSLGEHLGEADPRPFGRVPLLLELLNEHSSRQADISRDGGLEVFWHRTVGVHTAEKSL